MKTRTLTVVAALSTMLVSSTAFAWAVPIHKCTFPKDPTPVGQPIPCSFTNEDGITFNGVVTVTGNGEVLCTGLAAPTPRDPTEAASIEKLYSSLGDDYGDAPWCALDGTPEGPIAECFDEPPGGDDPWAAVKICGDGWCLELNAYVDCNDYYDQEKRVEGVSCYDIV
ncbi:MAG TPA: hypothetical protein VK034_19500 [Enhygromyxa sp.]|nr:hypothetical protein [Enhygromyxa sp.]